MASILLSVLKNKIVISFIHDGRIAIKKEEDGIMDCETYVKYDKIGSMIMYLVDSIMPQRERKKKRFLRTT